MKNYDYITFDNTHSDMDERENITFYIDGFPEDENEEGSVIATVTLTKSNDTYIDWHYNGYRANEKVLELIDDVIKNRFPRLIKEKTKECRENKAEFITNLRNLLATYSSEYADIKSLRYIVDDYDCEWLYVIYESDAQKRININADSCKAILEDFLANVNSVDWLSPSEKI